jgi:hypothetical protein
MTDYIKIADSVRRISPDLRGVFALSDLRNLFNTKNKFALYRLVKRLENADVLSRFSRGFYVAKDFDPAALSQRICPESYVSFGNVLAENLLIGSIPGRRLMAVKTGETRIYDNGNYRIEQLRLTKSLFFGYKVVNGVNIAVPEKAVLDTLYFYRMGRKFSFDIYSDVDYSGLNMNTLADYIERYRNPVFRDFARKSIHA